MVFFVVLLTEEGQKLCKEKCFSAEKAPIPKHPPSSFPKYSSNPTDLTIEGMLLKLSLDDVKDQDKEHPEVTKEDSLLVEEDSNDGKAESSGEESDHPPDVVVQEEHTVGNKQEGPPKKKRKVAQPLPCTLKQFTLLLERLLVFHAWYKNGSPFRIASSPEDKKVVWTKFRELMLYIKHAVPRDDGCGWQLQKLHDLLHILLAMEQYGSTDNFDASHGERNLKYWVKYPDITCQKRGQKLFLSQMSSRMSESLSLREALVSQTAWETLKERKQGVETVDERYFLGNPSCQIKKHEKSNLLTSKWHTKAKRQRHRVLHPCVMSWLEKIEKHEGSNQLISNFDYYVSSGGESLFFYTEAKHRGITLRAHPDYTKSGSGPWYDFAFVQFAGRNGLEDFPARILAFFKGADKDGLEVYFTIVYAAGCSTTTEESLVDGHCMQISDGDYNWKKGEEERRCCQQSQIKTSMRPIKSHSKRDIGVRRGPRSAPGYG